MAFLEFDLNGSSNKVELTKEITLIGRAPEADLRFDDEEMSRKHCSIIQKDGKFSVRDESSTNGTILNDTLIKALVPVELKNEDELKVGNTFLTFRA